MKHYKQTNGIRGLATLSVVATHWLAQGNILLHDSSAYSLVSMFGELGMYCFFVLSGFLISGILFNTRQIAEKQKASKLFAWRNFYLRRTLRIFPIYYLTLAFLFFFNVNWFRGPSAWHFGYLSNYYFYQRGSYDLGGHLWSLSAEEQFYIIWPILMLFVPFKFVKKVIIFFLITAPLFRMGMNYFNPSEFTQLLTPSVFDGFGLGALLAYWNSNPLTVSKSLVTKATNISGIIGLTLLVLFFTTPFGWNIWNRYHPFHDIFYRSSFALIGFYLVYGSVREFKGFGKSFLENPINLYFGKISYAMYIFHNFQLNLFEWFKIPMPITGWYIILHFAILIVLSSLSWYLFELPINNLKKYFPYIKKEGVNEPDNSKLLLASVKIGDEKVHNENK